MLVLVPGEEVSSVHASPVPVVWEGIGINLFPGVNWKWLLTTLEESLSDSASTLLHEHVSLHGDLRVILSLLDIFVSWIVLLSISGLMHNVFGPGVLWSSPGAVRLNSNVVDTSNDSNETIFSVVSSPGVSDGPVFDTVVNTPSSMSQKRVSGCGRQRYRPVLALEGGCSSWDVMI